MVQDLDEDAGDVEHLGRLGVAFVRAVRLVRFGEEFHREVLEVQLVLLARLRQRRPRLGALQLLQEFAHQRVELCRSLLRLHALLHRVHAAVVGHLGVRAGHLVRALQERRQRLDVSHGRGRSDASPRRLVVCFVSVLIFEAIGTQSRDVSESVRVTGHTLCNMRIPHPPTAHVCD